MQRVRRRDYQAHGIRTPHRWAVVLLYVAAIYCTLPYAPRIWEGAAVRTGASLDSLAFYPLIIAASAVAIAALLRSGTDLRTVLGLAVLGGIYVYLYGHAFQAAAEKLHLLEYGLLPWAIWWAWQPALPTAAGALLVFVLSAALGAADELIQSQTPGRVGEFRDVLLNWESSALGLGVLRMLSKPPPAFAQAESCGYDERP